MTRSTTPAAAPADSWTRRAALPAVMLTGVIVTLVVPLSFPAGGGSTGADLTLERTIHSALDAHTWVYRVLVFPSNSYVVLPLLFVSAAWFASRRQWWLAGFALVAPELAVTVNTFALKPFWERKLDHFLAYPSGHTVQLVAVVTAFALVTESGRVRTATGIVMVAVLPAVMIGMVGFGYHHPTDVLGGTTAAVALVTALYLPFRYLTATPVAAPSNTTPPPR
ncbi:phosphatase PAP2 family protein [Nocardia aurantiaca]|uniref:Phosphatase PAP2 family protein n=1 Tax=Nocardia aurantiaca TaxID=2675850 RepID=A0A6I3L012_9NOCA|nr:phosphatase PAP2 family protein [Nocardia aurantiaca]MTE14598.1 phosphatase PAP2 family protein [Nocardia aurantiaca]